MTFDISDLSGARDPYALFAAARSEAPVQRMSSGFWAVMGHRAATAVLHADSFCSSPIGSIYRDRVPPGAARDEMSHRINFLDPPDHPRVRRVLAKVFTPRRVAELVPWIRATTEAHLATVDSSGPFDLLTEVAHEIPSLVVSELLGVPLADRSRLTELADRVSPLLSPTVSQLDIDHAVEAAEEMHRYFRTLIDCRRGQLGGDVLSTLARGSDDERLSDPELLSLAATLYSAGHRTTRDAFVNGMARLLDDDAALYREMREHQWGVDAVVQELLRLDTPTLYVARVAARDSHIEEHVIPAGEIVLVMLAAANRDPSVFVDPDTFRVDRKAAPLLSFAHGVHYCLGAALATAELTSMLEAVVKQWPDLRALDADRAWHQRGPFRGLDHLMVSAGPNRELA